MNMVGSSDEDVHEVRVLERAFHVLLDHQNAGVGVLNDLNLVPHDVGVGRRKSRRGFVEHDHGGFDH